MLRNKWGSEHRNTSPLIYLFLSTKYSILLDEYFGHSIPEIRFRVIINPNIPLKNIYTFRLKRIQRPIQYIKRTEAGVIKRYLRCRPRCLGGYSADGKKNPT